MQLLQVSNSGGSLLSLPIVLSNQELVAGIVMLDPPPFDFETTEFTTSWFSWQSHLVKKLAPTPPKKPDDLIERLERALNQTHRILVLKLDLMPFWAAIDEQGFSSRAWTTRFLSSMAELAGESGAAWKSESTAWAVFLLPGKLDPKLLLHQVEKTFVWPSSLIPNWDTQVISSSQELLAWQQQLS